MDLLCSQCKKPGACWKIFTKPIKIEGDFTEGDFIIGGKNDSISSPDLILCDECNTLRCKENKKNIKILDNKISNVYQ